MLKTDANPGGLPIEVFDCLRASRPDRRGHCSAARQHQQPGSGAAAARRQPTIAVTVQIPHRVPQLPRTWLVSGQIAQPWVSG